MHKYLVDSAKDVHKSYFDARTSLRQNIDAMADKAALFIDRPTEADGHGAKHQEARPPVLIVSDRDELRDQEFSCDQHLPGRDKTALKSQTIDWSNVRDEVRTFYYCLENIHNDLLFVRAWAASDPPGLDRQEVLKRIASLKSKVKRQGSRLSALMSASNEKIEVLRLRELPQGYVRYQLGLAQ